eukprot:gene15808-biopygen88115
MSETASSTQEEESEGISKGVDGKGIDDESETAKSDKKKSRRGGWRERFMGRGGKRVDSPSLLLWNARGLMTGKGHKLSELAEIAAAKRPAVIAITESHLDDSFQNGEVTIAGYDIVRQDRDKQLSKKKKGGGVIVYVREELEATVVLSKAGEDFELVAVDMPGEIRYAILYRVPGSTISGNALETIEKVLSVKGKRLLAGDLNMNTKAKTPVPRALRSLLADEIKLQQKVQFVTRHRKSGGSTIDHIWTDVPCRCKPEGQLHGMSDHVAVQACHLQDWEIQNEQPKVIWRRKWDEAMEKGGADEMVRIIRREMRKAKTQPKWKGFFSDEAAQEMAASGVGEQQRPQKEPSLQALMKAWDDAWGCIKKEIAPLERIKVQAQRRSKKWFTKDLKQLIREREEKFEAVKAAVEEQTHQAEQELKAAAQAAKQAVNAAKRQYYQKELAKTPGKRITSRKEGWKLWNEVSGRKRKCKATPDCSADQINEAFLAKIRNIREPLLQQPAKTPADVNVAKMQAFQPIDIRDVKAALKKDRGTSSVGIDEVPMSVLKKIGPSVAGEIAAIANTCVREKKWPEQWKQAEIIPIWKNKGNKKEVRYYRPVSMLPAISRLVERILAEQLKEHISKHSVLPKFQHGFRAKHSTETTIMQLVDTIATAMGEGKVTLVASLDLAGAFDTLDRDVLVGKLKKTCGITDSVAAFVDDYLRQRKQRVKKQEEKSGWKDNPWGVPQGSVLGPLLFTLYCADISETVKSATISQYADDVTLVVTADTADAAVEQMNRALAEFEEYATGNRLAAEPAKTQLMVCRSRSRKNDAPIVCQMTHGEYVHVIVPSKTMKILGVTMDERLSWETHNAAAAGKASGIARSIARGTKFLRLSDRAVLIEALSHPHLEYCQSALANPSAEARSSVQRAYNRTARIATRLERSEPALTRLGWPKWEEKRASIRQALVCKIWNDEEPKCLRELLPEQDNRQTGRSRADARGEIDTLSFRPGVGGKAFRSWGPEEYNAVCRKVHTRQEPAEKAGDEEESSRKKGHEPADENAVERHGYYAYLDAKYQGKEWSRDEEGRKIIWTDGSAVQDESGRCRAGAGIFYGVGSKNNRALEVTGPQTNQRAELRAVLHCLENEPEPMHIKTDSMYVQSGIATYRHRWRAKGWYSRPVKCEEIGHADLWHRVDHLLQQRKEGEVVVSWVKGHALPRHINAGMTSEEDIWGNNQADILAGKASAALR